MGIRYRLAAVFGTVALASASAAALKYSGSPPNIELLMPFVLATGLMLGPLAGLANGLLSRALYDLFIAQPGPWTPGMAASYGLVGLAAGLIPLFAGRRAFSRIELVGFTVALTILYDLLSLLAFIPMFGVPTMVTLGLQVPFTINHVLGNSLFVFAFTPLLSGVLAKASALDAQESQVPQPARYNL
jgi:energy-coupling factor transport system substrate-specific component